MWTEPYVKHGESRLCCVRYSGNGVDSITTGISYVSRFWFGGGGTTEEVPFLISRLWFVGQCNQLSIFIRTEVVGNCFKSSIYIFSHLLKKMKFTLLGCTQAVSKIAGRASRHSIKMYQRNQSSNVPNWPCSQQY